VSFGARGRVVLAMLLLAGSPVRAQAPSAAAAVPPPSPPGPYVIDLRGATGGLPQSQTFYPIFPNGTTVAKRGFGIDAGGHVYPMRLGFARLGLGVNVTWLRGTAATVLTSTESTGTGTGSSTGDIGATPAGAISATGSTAAAAATTATPTTSTINVTTTARYVSPQVSVNFGTHDGWSYLSGGVDVGSVSSRSTGAAALSHDSGTKTGANFGGGARWFLGEHLGVGFDLRFHRLPGAHQFAATAGVSDR